MQNRYDLRVPALEILQGQRSIFIFGIDGKKIENFATVSRVHRDQDDDLQGYQRPEVLAHIRAIRRYLESEDAMLPNAIVLAFDDRVYFEKSGPGNEFSTPGELVIPIDTNADETDRPAWLVDGQQRSAAIRDAHIDTFPVAAVGFIAGSQDEQRSQFILVNNTKPLPKGLIHELLPETIGHLPAKYARRKLPAYIMTRLNNDSDSPFYGLVSTPTTPDGYIKDNSVLRMVEDSLYEGALFQYRNPTDGTGDEEQMLFHLKSFWKIVQNQWPEAWSLPPRKSRLTHGVGIRALGYLMDSTTEGIPAAEVAGLGLEETLARIENQAAWTTGNWSFGPEDQRRWNGLQNTPTDVRLLANFLQQI
jgi:DGQHR domain-containing protein